MCFKCNNSGHLAKVCKGKPNQQRYLFGERDWKETHRVECNYATGPEEYPEYNLFNLGDSSVAPIQVLAVVNGIETLFEVDTGATKSIISQNTYELLWPSSQAPIMHATDVQLRTYTGEPIKIRGEIRVELKLSNQQH